MGHLLEPVRVMIVEDSPTVRAFLRRAIEAEPMLSIVAECESAEDALARLETAAPDVISMDIQLPRMSGLEATRTIMERRPTPIVIVSRSVNAGDLDPTMDALRAGAVSAVEAPTGKQGGGSAQTAAKICRELAVMSQIKVVRQRFNQSRVRSTAIQRPAVSLSSTVAPSPRQVAMIGVVASTGGPHALETVLNGIGNDVSVPILLVQHITNAFHAGFVAWLNRVSPLPVSAARDGQLPDPGNVYVAPAEKHLVVRGRHLALDGGPPVDNQRPSGTLLLKSMADSLGARAAGVVLTGMGRDGAEGLLAIRQAGGYTITEDDSTAVVNGMPEAARELGASCATLPLNEIGPALFRLAPCEQEVCA